MAREMKDSGISWIGLIPYDWKIMRLKYVADFYNGDRGSNYPSGDDLVEEGIPFLTSNNIHGETLDVSDEITKYITQEKYDSLGGAKVMKNDIIFCLRGSVGTCAINKSIDEGTVASSLVDIRPKKIDPNFLNYILNSPLAEIQTLDFMNGSCALNLSAENVSSYVIFVPSILEQHRISTYLDEKVKEINNVIEKTKETIELYKKYKQAIIAEAVTKGLDKNVKMKDSGIEWIGYIPENWKVIKFKYIHGKANVGDSITKEYWTNGEHDNVFYSAGSEPIRTNYSSFPEWKKVKKNDLLLARNGTPYVYLPIEGSAYSDHIIRVGISKPYNKKYIRYCIQQSITSTIVDTVSIPTWSLSLWDNQYIPLIEKKEQQKIADFLDKKCTYIDSLIENKNNLLKEIENYKKSLIYEYVTGKKEVK